MGHCEKMSGSEILPSGRRKSDLAVIKDLAVRLQRQNTLDDLLWDITLAIGSLPGFEDSIVYLSEANDLVQKAAFGLKDQGQRRVRNPIRIPIGCGIVGAVAASGRAELVPDTSVDPRYIRDEYEGMSELTVPVVFEGRVIAVLDTENRRLNAYSESDLEILQCIANISASRIASAIAERDKQKAQLDLAELNRDLEFRIERRTAELVAARDAVARDRDRLSSILNSIQNGLLVLSEDFRIREMSPSAAELCGWTPDEASGLSLETVFCLAGVLNIRQLVASSCHLRSASEHTLVSRTGVRTEIRWNAGMTTGVQGQRREYVIIFSDITEQKFLTRQAERLDRIQSLGLLAGGLAHDFNNDLTVIQSAVSSIEQNAAPEQKTAIDLTIRACQKARQLTQQLVTFAKGGSPVRKAENIIAILESTALMATSGSRVTVEWLLEPGLPDGYVDIGQISQVFSNLFINAVQAMIHGGRIVVEGRQKVISPGDASRRMIEVIVRDFGPGIADEQLEKIFDPYYTSRSNGVGLGLTTSFFIMKSHEGEISAKNADGGGAQFTVLIPAARVPDSSSQSKPQNSPHAGGLVLLLDDDLLVLRSVGLLIESLGYTVVEATRGEEALEVARQYRQQQKVIDAAILDLTIRGGLGGLEILNELKQISPQTACIVSSGYNDSPAMAQYLELGFDGVLSKPFTRSTLDQVLRSSGRRQVTGIAAEKPTMD